MEDILKKLGARIREERKKASLTQEKLAELTELSIDFIGYIERGKQAPYLKTLGRIANALGVEVYELFIFQDKGKRTEKEKAKNDLLSVLRNKEPDDIRLMTAIIEQVFQWQENKAGKN